jgi:hypothetical protein
MKLCTRVRNRQLGYIMHVWYQPATSRAKHSENLPRVIPTANFPVGANSQRCEV